MPVPIPIEIVLDDAVLRSETLAIAAGAHVLTIATTVPRDDLALELHSTYVGHPSLPTHVTHLRLGPRARTNTIECASGGLDVTFDPRSCVYDHAQRLLEHLLESGDDARIVLSEGAFAALEAPGAPLADR